ncbi:MAG TPA: IS3 family transposase, partial [Bacteroidales bacterium]|nr:IS3 family transposase [Bacteroidales bacterium]
MMVKRNHKLSIRQQCELLEIPRSGLYYKPVKEQEENLHIMRLLDEEYLKHPTHGVLRMQDFLLGLSIVVNHKKVRRLLRL